MRIFPHLTRVRSRTIVAAFRGRSLLVYSTLTCDAPRRVDGRRHCAHSPSSGSHDAVCLCVLRCTAFASLRVAPLPARVTQPRRTHGLAFITNVLVVRLFALSAFRRVARDARLRPPQHSRTQRRLRCVRSLGSQLTARTAPTRTRLARRQRVLAHVCRHSACGLDAAARLPLTDKDIKFSRITRV